MSAMKYMPGVDGLRAVAVMSVLLFHAGFSSLAGGYVGVDVFFVISGFLITKLIYSEVSSSGCFDYHRFYSRRVRRLFPALFVVVFCSFFVSLFLFSSEHLKRFGGEVVYSLFSLSNFYFWSESGYFNTSSDFKPLLHTWSLSVEEQFYMFWPVVLVFFGKRFGAKGIVSFLVVGGVLSLLANFSFIDGYSSAVAWAGQTVAKWFADGASTVFYLTPFRVFEFAIGAILVFIPQVKSNAFQNVAFTAGLSLIVYSIFKFDSLTPFPTYNALFPCIGAALIVFSSSSPVSRYTLSTKPFVFLGMISYSVYLVHWPIIVFYKYYFSGETSVYAKFVIIFLSLVLGYALYKTVETPLRRPNEKSLTSNGFNLTCLMLACLLVVPASTAWGNSGWVWRVAEPPEGIKRQLADSKQFHVDQYGGNGYPERYGWIVGGADGLADIVVMGDSHARQYAYGFDHAIGKPNKLSIYISTVSCIMLPGVTRLTPGTDWDSICPAALDQAISVLKKNPNSVLVISEFWYEQIKYAARLGEKKPIEQDSAYQFLNGKILELKSLIGSHELVVIGNVPGAGSPDIAGCYSRPSIGRGDCLRRIGIPYSDVPSAKLNRSLSLLSEEKGVYFVDPQRSLCDGGFCKSISKERILYSDSHHLSKAGSEYVIYANKDLFLRLVTKSRSVSTSN
ncbi:acyltransferase family protein [Pseudomonas aeruginosa]|uniref:acyltransferase family protein n=1 Tax=Pseudomonas aeruginosa TaxID=287 RepID=UPI00249A886F|nr:acyltransferase family protein [Pseudomonas aeruginosa]MDI2707701.1 acyltransferase family protein [Pseudomonas aeruginosa]